MRKSALFLVFMTVMVAAGCARKVNKDWVATGGSRADATIELSYEYYPNTEMPILNEQQGLDLAIARCRSWGYRSAEAFGGAKSVCNAWMGGFDGPTCLQMLVTKQYQCLGRGSEASTK